MPDAPDPPPLPPRPRAMAVVLGLAIPLLLGYAGAWAHAYWLVRTKILAELDENTRVEFHKFRFEEEALPPEAFDVRPFDPVTVEAARAFRAEWEKVEPEARRIAAEADETTGTATGLALPIPLLRSFHELVGRPDYEIAIAMTGGAPSASGIEDPFLVAVMACASLTQYQAREHLAAGRMEPAISCRALLVKGARANRFDPLIARLCAVRIRGRATDCLLAILEANPPPDRLRELLDVERELAKLPDLVHPTGFLSEASIGVLREAKRFGVEIETGPRSRYQRFIDWQRAGIDTKERFVLPRLTNGQARDDLTDEIRHFREGESTLRGAPTLLPYRWSAGVIIAHIFFHQPVPDYLEAWTRERVARVRADLALVALASALYELERGRPPERPEDLVPDYLPEWPTDRFTVTKDRPRGEGLRFHPVPYSVGPDGVDDGAARAYDPKEGPKGKGDVIGKRVGVESHPR